MSTVAIVDYGSGNLHSAVKAFERAARNLDHPPQVVLTSRAADVAAADRVVLPGVGAFGACKRGLLALPDMVETMTRVVHERGRPFLGICVGMQLLATRGLEFDETAGLDWIPGDVRRIEPRATTVKIPHMGWNTLRSRRPHAIFDGVTPGGPDAAPDGAHAYFVHSFQLLPTDPDTVVADTDHGGPITAIVARDTIVGVQFHPEKSQAVGLRMIADFLRWRP
jgi:glutamine amidotransferase